MCIIIIIIIINIIILYPSYFSIFSWISKTKAKVLAMSQSTILLLPCANQNALEDSLVHFTVQNSFENYIFMKVAEVLVVQPKSSDSVHALTSHEQGQLSTKTNKTCTYWEHAVKIN